MIHFGCTLWFSERFGGHLMVLPKCVLVLVFTLPKRTKRTRSKHPFSPMYLPFLICAQYLCLPHQNVQSKEPAMHNLSSPLLFLHKLCTGAFLCTNLPPAFFGTVQWIVNDFTLRSRPFKITQSQYYIIWRVLANPRKLALKLVPSSTMITQSLYCNMLQQCFPMAHAWARSVSISCILRSSTVLTF